LEKLCFLSGPFFTCFAINRPPIIALMWFLRHLHNALPKAMPSKVVALNKVKYTDELGAS
jgi:hypothetical protein